MKLIKKFFTNFTSKNVDYYKDKYLLKDDYILKKVNDTEIICSLKNVDYFFSKICETNSILALYGISFCDHIKIVFDMPENFSSAYFASAISIENIDPWRASPCVDQELIIIHLIYLTLLAKEFQENKYFIGLLFFSSKKRKVLKCRAEEIFKHAAIIPPQFTWS
jgi:hypothetical protein